VGEMIIQYELQYSLRIDGEDSKESERVLMPSTLGETKEKETVLRKLYLKQV
jgi:hypothetical protein